MIPSAQELDAWVEGMKSGHAVTEMLPRFVEGYRKLLKVAEAAEPIIGENEDEAYSILCLEIPAACEALDNLQAALYDVRGGRPPCPYRHRCHGPLKFCDECGDVSMVCDDATCDAHPNLLDALRAPVPEETT